MGEQIETVIVGGGQAGLSLSYHLGRLGRRHVILERSRIGESWRSERWDSLMFQFPNWAIRLAGHGYQSDDPNGFVHKDEVVHFLEDYARRIDAPVRCGARVQAVRQRTQSTGFLVDSSVGTFEADNVVAATGSFHDPLIPSAHVGLPNDIVQIHSSAYRNPQQLPLGKVLVVGGGASGVQIAQELNEFRPQGLPLDWALPTNAAHLSRARPLLVVRCAQHLGSVGRAISRLEARSTFYRQRRRRGARHGPTTVPGRWRHAARTDARHHGRQDHFC